MNDLCSYSTMVLNYYTARQKKLDDHNYQGVILSNGYSVLLLAWVVLLINWQ